MQENADGESKAWMQAFSFEHDCFLEAVCLSCNQDEIKVSFHHILSSKRAAAAAACRWLRLQQHLHGVQPLLLKRGECAADIASSVDFGG